MAYLPLVVASLFGLALNGFAFNIADIGKTEKYFKRSLNPSFGDTGHFFSGNSFFGYDLQVKILTSAGNVGVIRIATGAPTEVVQTYKDSDKEEGGIIKEPNPSLRASLSSTSAMGSLYLCETSRDFISNMSSHSIENCSIRANVDRDLSGFEISERDALGISLTGLTPTSGASDDEQLITCASLRIHDCGSTYKMEGACYFSERVPGRGDSLMITRWQKRVPCRDSCFEKPIDLMFVLDGSYSVTNASFEKVKQWVKDVTEGFDIKSQVQVGVVQYSYFYPNKKKQKYMATEVPLGNFTDKKEFDAKVDAIVYHGYSTYTAHAINKTVKEDFKGPASRYPESRRVMILLTDGNADDLAELPEATAYAVSQGVETFAVGVSDYIYSQLVMIAGNKDNVITVDNFDDLSTIVSQVQKGIQIMEGGGAPGINNELMQCQVGLSTTVDKSGRLVLGTVGAYDWAGTLTIYSSTTDETPDIPDFEQVKSVLPNRTKESYLGYSVTTGFYNGPTVSEYIASGAPRYNLEGAVVVYRPESLNNNKNFTNSHTIRAHADFKQLGSYFGGTLLTVDVNNDRHDDLLVGAPLYIGTSYYDEGRVFVYVTDETSLDNVARWASQSYKPQELIGTMAGGRLGTAIASAGDLNDDGYNDVIVGAPLADGDRGAVFVFHGSATGLITTAKQVIRAKDLTATKLEYFGQSLQGGVDLDGNRYPDLAVGAPKSDTVVIFRTRPVVKFTSSLSFTKSSIDVLECFNTPNRQCVEVLACLSYAGKSVEETLEVNYNITLDKTRLEFRDQANSTTGQFDTSGVRTLTKDNAPNCWTTKVYVKQNIQDYSSLLTASMTYDLTQVHKELPLSSVRDPTIPNTVSATTEFSKSCGPDKVCRYDLKLVTTLTLPSNVPSQEQDFSNNGQRLIIAPSTATTPIIVRVNLSNSGENAFDTRVIVTLSDPLSWTNVEDKSSSNAAFNNCIQDQGDVGNSSYKVLRYVHNTTLGSIMRQNDWCAFTIALSPSAFKASGTVGDMVVTILAETVSAGVQNDTNPGDNSWRAERQVRYRSDTDLTRVVIPDTALFNFTETNDTINSVEQIGNTSADMEYQYELKGLGFSNIPEANLILDFPSRLNENQHLLYPFEVGCTSDSRTTCVCNQTLVNPYNLTLPGAGVNDTGPNITMYANTVPFTKRTNFNCGSGGNNSNFCQAITCKLYNLDQQSIVLFTVKFRLWTKAYNFKDFNVSTFTSQITLDTTPSKFIIFEDGSTSSIKSRDIKTQVEKYYPPEPEVKQPDLLWVYIVAAVAGLLLLLIIIAIMYKTGFFKSKYADMKQDQLEWNEANENGAGMEQQEEMLQS